MGVTEPARFELDRKIIRFEKVDSIEDYLEIREQDRAQRLAASSGSPHRRLEQQEMSNHAFISYSRADRDYARNLENELRKRGFEVWIDDRIEFGDRWWQTVDQAIRGCAAFIVVMTPDSEKSEWVEKEILLAKRGEKLIVPLLLRGEEFSLLIDMQYVDVIGGKMPPQGFYDRLSKHVLPEQAAQPTADRQPSAPETVFDPPDTDTRIRTWQHNAGSGVAAVDVSPDGETVVAGTLGNRVLCLDSEGYQRWQAEVGNQAWRVALSADGGTTVVGTGSTRPWDMGGRGLFCFNGDGSLRWQVELKASVWGLDLSADGETVAAGTDARQLILFDGRGNRLWHQDVRGLGWYAWVWSAAVSADGGTIVAGAADKRVRLFERSGVLLAEHQARADVFTVAVSANGEAAAAGDAKGYVYWLTRQGRLRWEEKLADKVWAVILSVNGERMLVGAGEKEPHLRAYDQTGRLLWRRYVEGGVGSLALSEDGQRTVAGTRDGAIHTFAADGDVVYKAQASKLVRQVAISATGEQVVAGSEDGHVYGFLLSPTPSEAIS